MDLISQHVADHQTQWENYLARHEIEKLYREITTALLDKQPEDPKKFIFDFLAEELGLAPPQGQAAANAVMPSLESDPRRLAPSPAP